MDDLRQVWHFIAGTDARRVDFLLFVLEFIVAALITVQFIWEVRRRNDERKIRKGILRYLSNLTDDERAELKKWVLVDDGGPSGPNERRTALTRKIPHAIRHQVSSGAEIREHYLHFLQEWARKQ